MKFTRDMTKKEKQAFEAMKEALRGFLDERNWGCDTADLQEEPPCGDCCACRARAALKLAGEE